MGFIIVLVEPKYEGNVGAVARAMKNFGLTNLRIVGSNIGEEAYKRAMHAKDVLENAEMVNTFEEGIQGLDYVAGTSGIVNLNEKKHIRNPLTLKEFAEKIYEIDGKIGLVFGREDFGLLNHELEKCDLVVTIPCDENYPVMNLSHAAALFFYELGTKKLIEKPTESSGFEKEKLHEHFSELLDEIDYTGYKKHGTKILFRRIIGRAGLSKWEFHRLMGVFSKVIKCEH
ncbi:MAG: RNA methyltransferase [Candidatus Thermoplasmatota archaeon]|nr:RNA methyltransferase [Candidatus Thermoplasmatota archaeon]